MTKKAPSLTAASMPLPEANGYYSLDDEKRMKALVRALLEGGRPIALSSASSDARKRTPGCDGSPGIHSNRASATPRDGSG